MIKERKITYYLNIAMEKLLKGEELETEELQLLDLASKREILDSLSSVLTIRGNQIMNVSQEQLSNYRLNVLYLKMLANGGSLELDGHAVQGISREDWLQDRDDERKVCISDSVETLRRELEIYSKRYESELRMKGTREETIAMAVKQWVDRNLQFYIEQGGELDETIRRFKYLNKTGAEFQLDDGEPNSPKHM